MYVCICAELTESDLREEPELWAFVGQQCGNCMSDVEQEIFKKLTGEFKHFCYEWDGMAIDETCGEFAFCTCDWGDQQWEVNDLKKKAYNDLFKDQRFCGF